MKKIEEVAQPNGGDEKAFKAKHKIAVKDYPEGTKVPATTTQKKKRLADYDTGQDEVAYEETSELFYSVTWRDLNGMDKREDGLTEEKAERLLSALETVGASLVSVYEMSDEQMKKREDYVKGMKSKSDDLRKRYGKRWKDVMYAIATKNAMREELSGAQHKVDANKNGKLDAHDFKLLRAKKMKKEEVELDETWSPTGKVGKHKETGEETKEYAKHDKEGRPTGERKWVSKSGKSMKEDIDEVEENFVSHAQRKAVWASKADGGKGHPDNKKKMKEEIEELDEKERTSNFIGTVHKDDPEYESKLSALKSKAIGGHRVRGRAPTPEHKAKYAKGGELHRFSSKDVKPEHASRVDVYGRKGVKEEIEELDEVGGNSTQKPISHPPTRPLAKSVEKKTTTVKEAGDVNPPNYPKMKSTEGGKNNFSLKKTRPETFNVPTEKDRALEMDEAAEQIDELSKQTLGNYIKAAKADQITKVGQEGRHYAGKRVDYQNREKGINRAVDKLTREETSTRAFELIQKLKQMQEEKLKEQIEKEIIETEVELTEVFKPGNLKLHDGNVILVTKEQAEPLNKLFHSLSDKNKKVMEDKLMKSRDSFSEILKFAKETM